MPRRAKLIKRETPYDPKYKNLVMAKFINKIMVDGKKSTARTIVYDTMDLIAEKTKSEPVEVFDQAIKNATPLLQVKSRRVGGATYQVPVEVRPDRGMALAMRWLIDNARARSGRSMAEKLASEMIDASQGQGAAVKKRQDTHKMAEANKAFAHYRW
ncbi:MAG: 30S ribosomal protein S7 [Chloroflexi bacterium]|nr:30S ribosomal protein S7 [Chloroflexota bacterium]MBM3154295.1 30S ribosomal protein S7 [Chloroflexota bacterium]MBM3172950.1 30S ribosomal protein S7 [Chloroflexota bacterium]MBM3174495.1 30S ribosomal protein S7 [Chloroflexota bacterium]MBM4449555.1 30S ribosomal protein S7 [Chloroflexota bacterium]